MSTFHHDRNYAASAEWKSCDAFTFQNSYIWLILTHLAIMIVEE
jgi:hypothetical protein